MNTTPSSPPKNHHPPHGEHRIDTGPAISRTPLAVGIMLLLIGIYFLLTQYGILPAIEKSWPVIVIFVGFGLIIGYILNATQRRR